MREGMELAGRAFAQMLAVVLGLAPRDAELRRLTSTALVAGVRHVILTRILEGREKQLHTLSDEVLDWCEAYRTPLAARVSLASAPRSTAPARQAPVAFRSLEEERARRRAVDTHFFFGAFDLVILPLTLFRIWSAARHEKQGQAVQAL